MTGWIHQQKYSSGKITKQADYWSLRAIRQRRRSRFLRKCIFGTLAIVLFLFWAQIGGAREIQRWINSRSKAREALASLRATTELSRYYDWAINLSWDQIQRLQSQPAIIEGPLYHPKDLLHPLETEWLKETPANPPWRRLCIQLLEVPASARDLNSSKSHYLLVVEASWSAGSNSSQKAITAIIEGPLQAFSF